MKIIINKQDRTTHTFIGEWNVYGLRGGVKWYFNHNVIRPINVAEEDTFPILYFNRSSSYEELTGIKFFIYKE